MKKIILLFLVFATFGCAAAYTSRTDGPAGSRPIDLAHAPPRIHHNWAFKIPGQISQISMSQNGKWVLVSSSQEKKGAAHVRLLESRSASAKVLWTRKIKEPVKSQALAPDGRFAAVSTYNNKLILFSRDGKILWEQPRLGRPLFLGGKVVLINDDDSQNRDVFFVYSMKGEPLSEIKSDALLLDAFPGTVSNTVYAAFKSGAVTQYDLNGNALGSFELSEPATDIVEDAAGTLLVATSRGIYKFQNGKKIWRAQTPSPADALGAVNGTLAVYANAKNAQWIAGYDLAAGKKLWFYSYPDGATVTLPFWTDARTALVFFDLHSNGLVQSAGLNAEGSAAFASRIEAPNGFYALAATRTEAGALVFVTGAGSPKAGVVDYWVAK